MRWLILALMIATTPAMADTWDPPGPPDKTCFSYDERYTAAPLFRLRVARQNLFDSARPCPAEGPCPWRRAVYLVRGDTVLAGPPRDGFRCAYFGTAHGHLITGFLPDQALQPEAETPAIAAALLRGRWNSASGDAHVLFSGEDGALRVTGEAERVGMWRGFTTRTRGEIDAPVRITPEAFTAHEPIADCTLTGTRRGPFLVLRDNSQCGGANVRFYGLFIRQS